MTASGSDAKTRVLQAIDVVELIGQSVKLKRRGKDYVGLCPFHQEKTPSFHVKPDKQYFVCYGCKAAGNAIDFVIRRDRVEFVEALRVLARHAGIDLPRFGGSKQDTSERQALLDAHSAAAALFEKFLSHPQHGQAARAYLQQRGFNEESIKRFRIGLAPEGWDLLLRHEAMKKFPPSLLQQAGLVKSRENGSGHYDTFRNRLMFPIRDENGRIIAFGGRAMPGSEDPAKYLNSPETPLFSKGRSAFGLDLARQKIVESRTVAVVEGYTDVVMAHQHGAANVVSVLGTAMTEHHVATLRRFADRIVLLFDADTAGDAAVNRAVELFLTQPVEIAIASMPDGIDPDEYLLERGLDGFEALLSGAEDALTYKWRQLDRVFRADGSLTGRQKAVEQYLQLLASARGSGPVDPIRWGAALARVSRLTDIPVEQLQRRYQTARPRGHVPAKTLASHESVGAPAVAGAAVTRIATADERAERWLMAVMLAEPARWHDVQQHVAPEDFTDEARTRLARAYWDCQRDEGEPQFNEFIGTLSSPELVSLAVELLEEIESQDVAQVLKIALEYLEDAHRLRKASELLADARRRSGETWSDEEQADLLRNVSEQSRKSNLRRVGPSSHSP